MLAMIASAVEVVWRISVQLREVKRLMDGIFDGCDGTASYFLWQSCMLKVLVGIDVMELLLRNLALGEAWRPFIEYLY